MPHVMPGTFQPAFKRSISAGPFHHNIKADATKEKFPADSYPALSRSMCCNSFPVFFIIGVSDVVPGRPPSLRSDTLPKFEHVNHFATLFRFCYLPFLIL